MKKCEFIIVDDHQLFADGLTRILEEEEGFKNIGSFTSEEEVMNSLNESSPDIIFLDIQLRNCSGIDVCKEIISLFPNIKIVLISMIQAPHLIKEGIKNGASGYIPKTTDAQILKDTIKQIQAGEKIFVTGDRDSEIELENDKMNLLSEREMEIIHLIKKGMSSKSIAEKLFLSHYTVETHRKNILKKLNLTSAQELVAYAYEKHL